LGYARVKGFIANPMRRDLKLEVEFVADTDAIYTMIPKSIAENFLLGRLIGGDLRLLVKRLWSILCLRLI